MTNGRFIKFKVSFMCELIEVKVGRGRGRGRERERKRKKVRE